VVLEPVATLALEHLQEDRRPGGTELEGVVEHPAQGRAVVARELAVEPAQVPLHRCGVERVHHHPLAVGGGAFHLPARRPGDGDDAPLPVGDRPLDPAVVVHAVGQFHAPVSAVGDDGPQPLGVERRLERPVGGERLGVQIHRRVPVVDAGPAVVPPRPGHQVDAHPPLAGRADGGVEPAEPLVAEEVEVVVFLAADAVDGSDLHAADPGVVEPRELPLQVTRFDGASHPPPPRPGTGLGRDRRPRGRSRQRPGRGAVARGRGRPAGARSPRIAVVASAVRVHARRLDARE